MRRVSWIGVSLVLCGLLPGFAGGVVASRTLFATSLNTGLVNAFSSVGQNLLGEGAFGASAIIPPDPVLPGGVQIDVSTATHLPVSMDFFIPPDPVIPPDPIAPCRRVAQVSVKNGIVIVSADQAFLGDHLIMNTQPIPGNAVVPAVCPAQAPGN
jgi:hypothetical protein